MSDDASPSEKNAPVALAAHDDAREIVRLIQCTQCSRPFRSPVTLPCGHSLCKPCLPAVHHSQDASQPDLPDACPEMICPFPDCGQAHFTRDCNIDVALVKLMDSIADVITKYRSMTETRSTLLEETGLTQDAPGQQRLAEKPRVREVTGSRLVATYSLAAQGDLDYRTRLTYHTTPETSEADRAIDISVLQEILDAAQKEVECQICYSLMLDPVTTFCGHTHCRQCLMRVLDHSLCCPVCRRTLAIAPALFRQPSNRTLVSLLNGLCPAMVAARAEAVAADERAGNGTTNVPLFVCTLGFPHQPTFLRIFEPRYRLMLRRCLEGDRQFGMLMHNRYGEPQGDLGPVEFYHYGTMLHIVQAQLLPNGQSVVETRGTYRFRVTSHQVVDGYLVGNVERFDDVPPAEEALIEAQETATAALPSAALSGDDGDLNRMSTQDLLSLCQAFIERMQDRSAIWLQQRVLDSHGQPPHDAALFPYWFATVLPISDEEKYKLLETRTVRERLKITAQWVRRIESQRW